MCGFLVFISGLKDAVQRAATAGEAIKHRGPDSTHILTVPYVVGAEGAEGAEGETITFVFHRLAINGLDSGSDQPFRFMTAEGQEIILVCNGEIYNYRELAQKHGLVYKTHSDCEVIAHLYMKYGIDMCCKLLDGEFAFVLYHPGVGLFAARDHLGVRPLYTCFWYDLDNKAHIAYASEAKGIVGLKLGRGSGEQIMQFEPRRWSKLTHDTIGYKTYYDLIYTPLDLGQETEQEICTEIRIRLTEAVRKRFIMADVEVGCLLSGGLDSSLVTALCVQFLKESGKSPSVLQTFSIGMPGSPDLAAARLVADHLGTTHHHVELTEREFLAGLVETVRVLGTYDVTTIRASVGHRLVSQWVRDHTNVKVLLSGEVSDEASGSYLYFCNAPGPQEFQDESIRLLRDIHFFDNLRSDRSIASAGLEARVPFSDKAFLDYYMRIPAELKMFGRETKMEKYLLRKAFSDLGEPLLPDEVLWRRKNGFSDAVSSKTRSWSVVIREMVDKVISDQEFAEYSATIVPGDARSKLKEGMYYKRLFDQFYPGCSQLTPYQWLPKWSGDTADPSARTLTAVYEAD